ncbi:DUF6280 family protein [Pseudomonas sp. IT-196MI5]|uniref:DUF6280 family protein n=1 Tax=Pseudomonas sp. IT-196MI5 TaxID=3026440 RepID=UPI0039E09FF5
MFARAVARRCRFGPGRGQGGQSVQLGRLRRPRNPATVRAGDGHPCALRHLRRAGGTGNQAAHRWQRVRRGRPVVQCAGARPGGRCAQGHPP